MSQEKQRLLVWRGVCSCVFCVAVLKGVASRPPTAAWGEESKAAKQNPEIIEMIPLDGHKGGNFLVSGGSLLCSGPLGAEKAML